MFCVSFYIRPYSQLEILILVFSSLSRFFVHCRVLDDYLYDCCKATLSIFSCICNPLLTACIVEINLQIHNKLSSRTRNHLYKAWPNTKIKHTTRKSKPKSVSEPNFRIHMDERITKSYNFENYKYKVLNGK